jgi:hypothetical protein
LYLIGLTCHFTRAKVSTPLVVPNRVNLSLHQG